MTRAWPRATENIVQVTQQGDFVQFVSWFRVKKQEFITCLPASRINRLDNSSKAGMQMLVKYPILVTYVVVILM